MKRFKSLNWYQKGILLLMSAMVLMFTVLYAKNSAEGFEYRDAILVPKQENGNTIYNGMIKGEKACFTVSADNVVEFQYGDKIYGPYVVKEDPTAILQYIDSEEYERWRGIELYCGEERIFRGGVYTIEEYRFFYEEEEESKEHVDSGAMVVTEIDPMEPSFSDILDLVEGPELTHMGTWIWLLWGCGVLICFIIAISIFFADEMFRFNLAFQIRNAHSAEPSDWEIARRYIAWTVSLGVAFRIFIIGLQL